MKTLLSFVVWLTLAGVAMPCGGDGLPAGSPGPEPNNPDLKSAIEAGAILDAGINAMGGPKALRDLQDVTRVMSGIRTDRGQGVHPTGIFDDDHPVVTNHPKVLSIRDYRSNRMYDGLQDTIVGGQPIDNFSVLTPDSGFRAFNHARYHAVRKFPAERLPPLRTLNLRRYPESLLLTARKRPQTLRRLPDAIFQGNKQHVIAMADADGAQLSLYFDAGTGLLTKYQMIRDDGTLGDVVTEMVFDDYRPVGPLKLPFRYRERVGGVLLQDLRASSITIDTHPSEDVFKLPQDAVELPRDPTGLKKLAEDVYAMLSPYNSMFIVFNEFVLVLEGGGDHPLSDANIEIIKKTAPGKPIRYLVATHFHFDHVAGVRSYIAQGATLVTTPQAKTTIETVAKTPHRLKPDALALHPRDLKFETFETFSSGKRVFDDGTHRVELYDISPTPHVAEMIIAYLPKQKLLFEADLLDIPLPGRVGPGGDDTMDLAFKIDHLKLDVERIIPVHGQPGTKEDLRLAITRRTGQ